MYEHRKKQCKDLPQVLPQLVIRNLQSQEMTTKLLPYALFSRLLLHLRLTKQLLSSSSSDRTEQSACLQKQSKKMNVRNEYQEHLNS